MLGALGDGELLARSDRGGEVLEVDRERRLDAAEIHARYRRDTGEIQGRDRGDAGQRGVGALTLALTLTLTLTLTLAPAPALDLPPPGTTEADSMVRFTAQRASCRERSTYEGGTGEVKARYGGEGVVQGALHL